jgi:DNA-binding IclR family transcriptional regulator
MQNDKSGINTLDRAWEILNCFGEEQKTMSLTEISRAIDLPKSTTHRFLAALESRGLLHHEDDNSGYRLGYQLIRWGMLARSAMPLHDTALPVLQMLTDETGETSVLSVRDGYSAVWLEQVESKQPVRWVKRVGLRVMLHAGSSSKVLWAFLPDAQIEKILNNIELIPLQANTITDKEAMRAELQNIRLRGYATSLEETDNGAIGIAAPVYDHYNQVAAGIGIIAPSARIPLGEIAQVAKVVMTAANQLSKYLGASEGMV